MTKREFELIEGVFHDGLGTYAEIVLANELVRLADCRQPVYPAGPAQDKMRSAIGRLPDGHSARDVFVSEMRNIATAALEAAHIISAQAADRIVSVRHTPADYQDAKAADILIELRAAQTLPISVKTDKSGKVAVAEGQTPDIYAKWAHRYFRLDKWELEHILAELNVSSLQQLKTDYLNVAEFVVTVIIRQLGLTNCTKTDLSTALCTDLGTLTHMLQQLRLFKCGTDRSRVVVLDRTTGRVTWETVLDTLNLEALSCSDVGFRPSRPKYGRRVGSEFCVKIGGRPVVTFQVKHKRGTAFGTARQYEFGDITTRLII